MIAYCGTDCLKCESYLVTKTGKYEELAGVAEKLAKLYHADVKLEYVICDGCNSGKRLSFHCANLCKM